jgi:ATP-dependent Clp protease ATP-binding subunit ClpA
MLRWLLLSRKLPDREIELRQHEVDQICKHFNKMERDANKAAEQTRKAEQAQIKKQLAEEKKQAAVRAREEKKRLAEEKKASQPIRGKRAISVFTCGGDSQMGPPKKYCILPNLQELDMVPDDDHAEEESYGSYAYPDPEACQASW